MGLLLLRGAVGLVVILEGAVYLAGHPDAKAMIWLTGLAAITSGVLLVVGFLTPIAAGIIALCVVAPALSGVSDMGRMPLGTRGYAVLAMAAAVALILLGPGALSIDARLFGRREIVIPRSSERAKS